MVPFIEIYNCSGFIFPKSATQTVPAGTPRSRIKFYIHSL